MAPDILLVAHPEGERLFLPLITTPARSKRALCADSRSLLSAPVGSLHMSRDACVHGCAGGAANGHPAVRLSWRGQALPPLRLLLLGQRPLNLLHALGIRRPHLVA